MQLSLNGQEWIDALSFKYHDAKIGRFAYVPNDLYASLSQEERERLWTQEEAEEVPVEGISEEERKKREDEQQKKASEEHEETQTVAKRRGTRLLIHGTGFIKGQTMVRFTCKGTVNKLVKPAYKTSKKLAVEVPDMGTEVEIGNHQLVVEVTVNGQQFTA